MDLYTLSDTFLAKDPIDEFVSAIWTERYSVKGDCQIVAQATTEMIDKLKEGTYLSLRGSKEVMLLESQSIEKGLLTVIGGTLPGFLDQRAGWFKNPDYNGTDVIEKIVDYTEELATVGQFIANVVDKMVINPVTLVAPFDTANLTWALDAIEHLSLGPVDTSGTPKRLTLPVGPLYKSISDLATKEGVGISLYLDSADPDSGYSLKFTTYRGIDHSTGGAGELVRLVPDMDSIQDLKELRSIATYKNVAYVYYQGTITKYLAEPLLPEPEGFARRVMVVTPEGNPTGHSETTPWHGGYGGFTSIVVGPADIAAFLEQNAKDALANNNYIRAIDGQSSPTSDYKYGVHYGLGDVIELEGLTGTISKARITEYIRSQDQTGEREYPTISVITPDA